MAPDKSHLWLWAIAHRCNANRTPKFPSKWMLFPIYQSPLATYPDTWNARLRKCVRKVMAIGYLLLFLVKQNFNILRNANNTRRLVRRFPALNDFLVYVQRNYFDGNFPIKCGKCSREKWITGATTLLKVSLLIKTIYVYSKSRILFLYYIFILK